MTAPFGIVHLERTSSTNDDLKKAVACSEKKLCICEYADSQSGGRGRRGRNFISGPGGIYFSFTLPLTGDETNIPFLTSIVGLCVCRAINERFSAEARIKWPNDIYINDRKICGILCELVSGGGGMTAIAGIGINNRHCDFPDELKDKVGCLEDFGFIIENPQEFITDAVSRVYCECYDRAGLVNVNMDTLSDLRRLSRSIGRKAVYEGKTGIVTDINGDGSVKIKFADETLDIATGEIIQQNS